MLEGSLVIQSAPDPRERLPGYLLRMAQINGYRSPRWILPASGARRLGDLGAPRAVAELASTLGLPIETVKDLAYLKSQKSCFHFFGQEVSVRRVLWRQPRVCPLCLREVEIASSLWDLPLIQACPLHARRLLSGCVTCGQPLTWQRSSVVHCACKSDLRAQETASAPHATVQVARRLAQACSLANTPAPTGFDTSSLNLNDLLYVIEFFGRRFGPDFALESAERNLARNDHSSLAENAGRLLENPVTHVCQIIDQKALANRDQKVGKSIEEYFSTMSKYNFPKAKIFTDSIRSSVRNAFDVRFSSEELTALGAPDKGPNQSLSRHRINMISGVSKGRTAAVLQRAGVEFVGNAAQSIAFAKYNPVLRDEAAFAEYCRDFSADLIPAEEVCNQLNLPDEYSVPEFTRKGLIEMVCLGGKSFYSAASLDRLSA